MKKLILALIVSAAPAAAQTTVRAPTSGASAIPGLGASFDGARFGATPMPTMMMPALSPVIQAPALSALALAPTPAPAVNIHAAAAKSVEGSPLSVLLDDSADMTKKTAALDSLFENSAPSSPEALAVSALPAAALAPQGRNEFSQAPAWFDVSKAKFDAVIKSGAGGIAVLRYGWRSQYEMSVFAFPGGESISFKEYPASPMGNPMQSFEATLETAAARKAAAKLLHAAQARNPVSGKDKAALDAILAFLEGA